MRHSQIAGRGSALRGAPWWRRVVIPIAFLAAAIWALYSFSQELYLEHQLSVQAAHLSAQNQALTTQNEGYQRDTMALASGAGAEEDARLNGYARSDEKVYLVGPPPTPSPASRPSAGTGGVHRGAAAAGRSWWSWLTNLFAR